MTYKINVLMLRKNRTVETRTIRPDEPFFIVRGNLYVVPNEGVNLIAYENRPSNPHSEIVYVEGNPVPICAKANTDDFLAKMIVEKILKDTGKPKGFLFEIIADYLKSPAKILMIVFAGIVVAAIVMGYIHP